MNLDSVEQWATVIGTAVTVLGLLGSGAVYTRRKVRRRKPQLESACYAAASRPRRVRDFSPYSLGVHRAITAGSGSNDTDASDFPTYVERDIDLYLRAAVEAARRSPKFVLLVGASSTGKTRSACAAIETTMPEWELLVPLTPQRLLEQLTTRKSWDRTVIWLNELQSVLAPPSNDDVAAKLWDLLQTEDSLLLIGTIWPVYYQDFVDAEITPQEEAATPTRTLLSAAEVIHVPTLFSEREMVAVKEAATDDATLRQALRFAERDVAQTLAAGPDLIRHWELAPNGYCSAVITAAVDANILGVDSGLTPKLLRRVAWSQLSGTEQAAARSADDWFDRALTYATQVLKGATSVLIADRGLEQDLSTTYSLADFVYQHGLSTRAAALVSDETWQALDEATDDAEDLLRLARSARERGAAVQAEALYRHAREVGQPEATVELAELLASQLRTSEAEAVLRGANNADATEGWLQLHRLLQAQGRVTESESVLRDAITAGVSEFQGTSMRRRPGPGDDYRAHHPQLGWTTGVSPFGPRSELTDMLLRQKRDQDAVAVWTLAMEELQPFARQHLARLLLRLDCPHEAEKLLRLATTDGEPGARYALSHLLTSSGRLSEVERLWEVGVAAKEPEAPQQLARLLLDRGSTSEAFDVLQAALSADPYAAIDLAHALLDHGDLTRATTVLRQSAARGTTAANVCLATLLGAEGNYEAAEVELRTAVAAREPDAWQGLVALLLLADDWGAAESVLRENSKPGAATAILGTLLRFATRIDEAERVWKEAVHTGQEQGRPGLAGLYAGQGDLAQAEKVLREGVTFGERHSTELLTNFLSLAATNADVELAWREAVASGVWNAREKLARLLQSAGRAQEAEQILRDSVAAGELNARQNLMLLLVDDGRHEEAVVCGREALFAGETTLLPLLMDALVASNEVPEAEALVADAQRLGWHAPKVLLADLRIRQGRSVEAESLLREAVEDGEWSALDLLIDLLGPDRIHALDDVAIEPSLGNIEVLERRGLPQRVELLTSEAGVAKQMRLAQNGSSLVRYMPAERDSEFALRRAALTGAWQGFGALATFLKQNGRANEAEHVATCGAIMQEYGAWLVLADVQWMQGFEVVALDVLWEAMARGERGAALELRHRLATLS